MGEFRSNYSIRIGSKIGDFKQSFALGRRQGLKHSMLSRRSTRPSEECSKILLSFDSLGALIELTYSIQFLSVMKLSCFSFYWPRTQSILAIQSFLFTILGSWPSSIVTYLDGERGSQEAPGNSVTFLPCFWYLSVLKIISANTQPKDHISTPVLYYFSMRITSGGLYQRDITCGDKDLF